MSSVFDRRFDWREVKNWKPGVPLYRFDNRKGTTSDIIPQRRSRMTPSERFRSRLVRRFARLMRIPIVVEINRLPGFRKPMRDG